MKTIEIFDPALCCSTGVCGPSVDTELLRVATVVASLRERGAVISRHNLASEPQDFVTNKTVAALLEKEGADILPVTLVDGDVLKTADYPSNDEFTLWTGLPATPGAPEKSKGCCCSPGCC